MIATLNQIEIQLLLVRGKIRQLAVNSRLKVLLLDDINLANESFEHEDILATLNCITVIVDKIHTKLESCGYPPFYFSPLLADLHRLQQMLIEIPTPVIPGPPGPQGEPGPIGPQGIPGLNGDIGPAGPNGDKGDTGPAGPNGDKGDTGPAGPKGDKGDTGPAGLKGDKGDTGPAGPKGDTGDTGPAGPKGDKGDTGPAGPAGRNAAPPTGNLINDPDFETENIFNPGTLAPFWNPTNANQVDAPTSALYSGVYAAQLGVNPDQSAQIFQAAPINDARPYQLTFAAQCNPDPATDRFLEVSVNFLNVNDEVLNTFTQGVTTVAGQYNTFVYIFDPAEDIPAGTTHAEIGFYKSAAGIAYLDLVTFGSQ